MVSPTGTVAFLFTDIEGSTTLWEHHPTAMREILERHDTLLRSVFESAGGFVFQHTGDGLAVAFTRAIDAVSAAVAAQVRLASECWPDAIVLRVRMAIHTGEAHERDGDYFGTPLNRTARLMGLAHGGQIVVSETTAPLLAAGDGLDLLPLGRRTLRGITEPVEVFGLDARDWPWDGRALATGPTVVVKLPLPASEFVGRSDDLDSLVRELEQHRLVTLTGPGGVGKTRLAIEAAWVAAETFTDGVWLVDLGSVTEPGAVVGAITTALGVRPQEGLGPIDAVIDALSDQRALILMDNCEHVLDSAATLVSRLVAECPKVCVLATSREPLRLSGETVWPVPPLAAGIEGLELFRQRAVAADPGFVVDDDNRPLLIGLCERLDGIPLAIELAAARVRALSVAGLVARIDDRFKLLRGGRGGVERHQTLRATVVWSYRLLEPSEQLLFDRLSVFAGGFDLDAVEAVVSDDQLDRDDVFDLLGGLVDKSMVTIDRSGDAMRYRLLETLRQFSEESLDERAEVLLLRERHLAYFCGIATDTAQRYAGPQALEASAILSAEWDNLRAAHSFALRLDDHQRADALCVELLTWASEHLWAEHADWIEAGLEAHGEDRPAELLGAAAIWAGHAGEYERARELSLDAIGNAPTPRSIETILAWTALSLSTYQLGLIDDLRNAVAGLETAIAVNGAADARVNPDFVLCIAAALLDPSTWQARAEAVKEEAARLGSPMLDGWMDFLSVLGVLYAGDIATALQLLEGATQRARATGNALVEGNLQGLRLVAASAGGEGAHESLFATILTELIAARNWSVVWWALEALGEHWARAGRLEPAAVLLGNLEANGRNSTRAFADRAGALALVESSPQSGALMARGAAMRRDELVSYTFGQLASP